VDRDGRRRAGVPIGARETLIEELRRHALVVGEVTLTSGATAQYYVDAKRAILRPAGFAALAELVAAYAAQWEATAVGGLTMGADAPACAALAGGADVKAFFVRKEVKQHGLSRSIEGPVLDAGDRCLIVEDVVTTGGSTRETIEVARAAGAAVVAAASIIDRSGGQQALDVPYHALATVALPTYDPSVCPMCQAGQPVVKPGSRAV
jgi:orotate phosphoribosyltransferase